MVSKCSDASFPRTRRCLSSSSLDSALRPPHPPPPCCLSAAEFCCRCWSVLKVSSYMFDGCSPDASLPRVDVAWRLVGGLSAGEG